MIRVSVVSALIAGGLLLAAPMPQPFHRPLAFEPNQGQAPAEFRWLGQSSSYQLLLDDESATIVIPDKTDLQAASARLPGTRPRLRLKYSAVRMRLAGSRSWRGCHDSGYRFAIGAGQCRQLRNCNPQHARSLTTGGKDDAGIGHSPDLADKAGGERWGRFGS